MPRKARPSNPQVANNQPYGQRKSQEETLASIPKSNPAAAPSPAAAPDPIAAAQGFQMPQLTPLGAPTERPGEPITAGLPVGAGPGPEALGALSPNEPSPDLLNALKMLPTLELMASMPGASLASRNMVKKLRAQIPMLGMGQSSPPAAQPMSPSTASAPSPQNPAMPNTNSSPSANPASPAQSPTVDPMSGV